MNMTKIKIFLLTSLALLLSACTLETDNDTGDLEGMWHLVRIENLVTGSGGSVKDLSSQKVFWSFQARLLELDDKSGGGSSYLYRFQIDNGQLTLKDPYLYDRENGDRVLSIYDSHLETYGIKSLTPVLKIESVRKGKLILSDSNVRLYFDKF